MDLTLELNGWPLRFHNYDDEIRLLSNCTNCNWLNIMQILVSKYLMWFI